MVDFNTLLKTASFTFLLGPDAEPMQIHPAIFEGLSAPLSAMVSNGMRESHERTATLSDIDPQTFVLFSEYAYTGMYRAPPNQGESAVGIRTPRLVYKHCGSCGLRRNVYDCNAKECVYDGILITDGDTLYCVCCGGLLPKSPDGSSRKPCICRKSLNARAIERSFAFKTYGAHGLLSDHLHSLRTSDQMSDKVACHAHLYVFIGQTSDKVACHAHLYVFADRFIIKPLKDLCLHKLHRDLNCLKLNKETVSEVVVMLVYAYMNTSGNAATEVCESGTGVGKELRELVLAYAVEKVDDLVRYAAFKDMMIDGGELAADITCATAERWISVVED